MSVAEFRPTALTPVFGRLLKLIKALDPRFTISVMFQKIINNVVPGVTSKTSTPGYTSV
jgi:hypothetical protein